MDTILNGLNDEIKCLAQRNEPAIHDLLTTLTDVLFKCLRR